MKNLDLLVPKKQEVTDRFTWATVEDVDPLRIRLDGEDEPLDITPDALEDVGRIEVGKRVWCQIYGRRVLVLGQVGTEPIELPEIPEPEPAPVMRLGSLEDLTWRTLHTEVWSSLTGWQSTNGFATPSVSGARLVTGDVRRDFGLNSGYPYRVKTITADWDWSVGSNGFYGRRWAVRRMGFDQWRILTFGGGGHTNFTATPSGDGFVYITNSATHVTVSIGDQHVSAELFGDASHWSYSFPTHVGANHIVGAFELQVPELAPSFGLHDTDWITPTLENGWQDYGGAFEPVGYRRINGSVELKGLVRNGTSGSTIMTMPDKFRPSGQVIQHALAQTRQGSSLEDFIVRINVLASGVVRPAKDASGAWISLAGVTFPCTA